MPKLIDPDQLTVATSIAATGSDPYVYNEGTGGNLIIDPAAKTIQLGVDATLEVDGGCPMQILYSKLKKAWRDSDGEYEVGADLHFYDFPMLSITNEQFELINGWDFADEESKYLIRDGGWGLNTGGTVVESWMNVTTLGNFDLTGSAGTAYFTQDGSTITDILVPGPVNQPVKIFDLGADATGGSGDINFDSTTTLSTGTDMQGSISVTDIIYVSGSTSNDGMYTVSAIDGTSITINETWVATGADAGAEIWTVNDNRDLDGDSVFRIYLRERGKLYDSYDLFSDQNIDSLTYKKYADRKSVV